MPVVCALSAKKQALGRLVARGTVQRAVRLLALFVLLLLLLGRGIDGGAFGGGIGGGIFAALLSALLFSICFTAPRIVLPLFGWVFRSVGCIVPRFCVLVGREAPVAGEGVEQWSK